MLYSSQFRKSEAQCFVVQTINLIRTPGVDSKRNFGFYSRRFLLFMFITTNQKINKEIEIKARNLAKEFSIDFANRGNSSLSQLMKKLEDDEVLVVEEKGLKFIKKENSEYFFHPNLAKIRITSLLKGCKDRLIEISGVENGDTVLDCTMGLATDSIIFSYAVGEKGKVITTESELIPYILARDGLKSYNSGIKEINEAMRRVEVIHINHLDFMKNLPDKSIDIVYFDPMFRTPTDTVALNPLRNLANKSSIRKEAVIEAKRIARKKVILKEQVKSGEFERLGFSITTGKSMISYGSINTF